MRSPAFAWLNAPPSQSFAVQFGYTFTPLQLLPVEPELELDEEELELEELLLELEELLLELDEPVPDTLPKPMEPLQCNHSESVPPPQV